MMQSIKARRFNLAFESPDLISGLRKAIITPEQQRKNQEMSLETNEETKRRENVKCVNQVWLETGKGAEQGSLETNAEIKRRGNQNPIDQFWIEAGKNDNLSSTSEQECNIFQKCLSPLLLLMKVFGLYFDNTGKYKILNLLSKTYSYANNVWIILIFISACAGETTNYFIDF